MWASKRAATTAVVWVDAKVALTAAKLAVQKVDEWVACWVAMTVAPKVAT